MEKTKMSAPWYTYCREVIELFKNDEDVLVDFNEDDDDKELVISVKNYEKSQAIQRLLPEKKTWGNVEMTINVIYSYKARSFEDVVKKAFEGNPVLKYTFATQTSTNPVVYAVFEKKVVQFWNDDLSDPHGVTSTLYEDIARDVFDENGLIYSTDSDIRFVREPEKKNQPTAEEIATWEKYNGEGSYGNGCCPKSNGEEPVKVKDKKTYYSIFHYKK